MYTGSMFSERLTSINRRMRWLESKNEPGHCQNELKTYSNVKRVYKGKVTSENI